ncbi:194_t:CDS:2 [Entrophospora sp. SA101]|nr:194_t:CDS:2 [Entrophospora sp. SA101]
MFSKYQYINRKHSGSQSPQLTQQQQPSPLRIQPSSSIQPQPQSPELTAYSKNDKETLYHSSMFRPPSPLQFNNNSSTNAAAPNQKHVFSVFNSSNNNIETTDPIFRHPSSSSTPTPHDHDSIKSNSTQQHNKQPSQTFNDSSPPTPSNNSGYNIHRDSHSNTFTSLTGPPLAGQANTLINPEIRPLKSITSLEQVYKMKFFDEKKPTWKFWILLYMDAEINQKHSNPIIIMPQEYYYTCCWKDCNLVYREQGKLLNHCYTDHIISLNENLLEYQCHWNSCKGAGFENKVGLFYHLRDTHLSFRLLEQKSNSIQQTADQASKEGLIQQQTIYSNSLNTSKHTEPLTNSEKIWHQNDDKIRMTNVLKRKYAEKNLTLSSKIALPKE